MKSIQVRTADGVRLVGMHLTRRSATSGTWRRAGARLHVTVARPRVRRVATRFARTAGVVMVDFRGHGRSEGRTHRRRPRGAGRGRHRPLGAGRRLPAVVDGRLLDGRRVVLRHAALSPGTTAGAGRAGRRGGQRERAVRWFIRDTVPMRRVHWLLETPAGRWVAEKALRTRVGGGWSVPPEWPVVVVGRIAPTPLLIVQGDRDRYFGVEHGRALAAAAPGADYWELAGFGHAEGALTPALVDRIAGWVAGAARRAGTMRP